jgi:hypothetical protein
MAERRRKRNSASKIPQCLKLLFAEDQVIMSNTDDKWQTAAFKLNQIMTEYVLTLSEKKKSKVI